VQLPDYLVLLLYGKLSYTSMGMLYRYTTTNENKNQPFCINHINNRYLIIRYEPESFHDALGMVQLCVCGQHIEGVGGDEEMLGPSYKRILVVARVFYVNL
jgi:hypothetical protein